MRLNDYDELALMSEEHHVKLVLKELEATFPQYWAEIDPMRGVAAARFATEIMEFERERQHYLDYLDIDSLDEYSYDPAAFKNSLKRDCPIVRRCLKSPAKAMDLYRVAFQSARPVELLKATTNIVRFGHDYVRQRDQQGRLHVARPSDLCLSELDSDDYTAPGVIGGGIRSHFLYNLYPKIFPNRGQKAIWALYFLTNRKDFGLRGGSEFLMVQDEGAQQNYFYPYEVFTYYALFIYRSIEQKLTEEHIAVDKEHRFVFVDTYFDFVADQHENDINILKPPSERFDL